MTDRKNRDERLAGKEKKRKRGEGNDQTGMDSRNEERVGTENDETNLAAVMVCTGDAGDGQKKPR